MSRALRLLLTVNQCYNVVVVLQSTQRYVLLSYQHNDVNTEPAGHAPASYITGGSDSRKAEEKYIITTKELCAREVLIPIK